MGLCQTKSEEQQTPSAEPITPPHTPLSAISLNHKKKNNNESADTPILPTLSAMMGISELKITPPNTPPVDNEAYNKTTHLQRPTTMNINIHLHQSSYDYDPNNPYTPQSDIDNDMYTPQTREHKINWTMRLASHPSIPNEPEQPHHRTGTFIKYATELVTSEAMYDIEESISIEPYFDHDLQSGVYIIGRYTKIPENNNNNNDDDENRSISINDIAPNHNLQNVSMITCGNGYDIYGIKNNKASNDKIKYLYGVGRNNYGQCGVGNWDGMITKKRIKFGKNIKITRVCASVTGESTFFLTDHNKVFACGRNNKSQLGFSNNDSLPTVNRNKPNLIKHLNNIIDIKCSCNIIQNQCKNYIQNNKS